MNTEPYNYRELREIQDTQPYRVTITQKSKYVEVSLRGMGKTLVDAMKGLESEFERLNEKYKGENK